MGTTAEIISNMGRLVEGHLSDADYQEYRDRLHLLKECKQKGFKRLKALGLIEESKQSDRRVKYSENEKVSLVSETRSLIENDGMTVNSAAAKLNVSSSSLREWAKKQGIKLPKGSKVTLFEQEKIIDLVNNKGNGFRKTCILRGFSYDSVKYQLSKRGLRYNAKKRRIENVTA